MPGDEISCPIHVIFYGDNFFQWSQTISSYLKGCNCDFMSLVTVLFQKKLTKKLILPMPFGLRIGKC